MLRSVRERASELLASRRQEASRPSRRLRKETQSAHKLAEATQLARAFFKGKVTQRAYAEGLARLYPVYSAMERCFAEVPDDDLLSGFNLPAMFRAEPILEDLEYFALTPSFGRSPASTAYHERITELAGDPSLRWLLGAHAYVRYLGDMYGGQIARKVAPKVLKLPEGMGVAFLSFPHVIDMPSFRDNFRARLDALATTPEQVDQLVAEANRAFDFNRQIAEELFAEL